MFLPGYLRQARLFSVPYPKASEQVKRPLIAHSTIIGLQVDVDCTEGSKADSKPFNTFLWRPKFTKSSRHIAEQRDLDSQVEISAELYAYVGCVQNRSHEISNFLTFHRRRGEPRNLESWKLGNF